MEEEQRQGEVGFVSFKTRCCWEIVARRGRKRRKRKGRRRRRRRKWSRRRRRNRRRRRSSDKMELDLYRSKLMRC